MQNRSYDTVVVSAGVGELLNDWVGALRPGGLLFVYGAPARLPALAVRLRRSLVFKYWIALDIDDAPRTDMLQPTHRGLLLFWKPGDGAKFQLNNATVRLPHACCAACGKSLKDWGGKRHQMNPRGAALSDVWRDLPRRPIRDHVIPDDVLARVRALTEREGARFRHVVEQPSSGCHSERPAEAVSREGEEPLNSITSERVDSEALRGVCPERSRRTQGDKLVDRVRHSDCLAFLDSCPPGTFDLCFADPPYNLQKLYRGYDDARAEQEYLAWCDRWLGGMARALKPGGSLFVLNLPKWAIHHAVFLNRHLEFRHWIAWAALSEPRGKIMPAHYALLYHTKPGALPTLNHTPLTLAPSGDVADNAVPNHTDSVVGRGTPRSDTLVLSPDAPKYCLRAKCIRERKAAGDDEKVELSDIWFDIHRLRHKRDRDAHPCQLPEMLMERIIALTTKPGDLVFDPFGGTGTTAVVARRLGRHYVLTDSDPEYVRVTQARLAAGDQPRASIKRPRAAASKREVELHLQQLAQKLQRVPTEGEIAPEMLGKIDRLYPYRSAALKRCRVVLS